MSYPDEIGEDISQDIVADPQGEYDSALSAKEYRFKFQLIKGRIAENLIQEMFLSEGYQVYKYGIENNMPYLSQQITRINTVQALSLRVAPDLVVFDSKAEKIHYVEVKYCSNGSFTLSQKINMSQYIECYPKTIFYFVTRYGVLEVGVEQFLESRTIDLSNSKFMVGQN